MPVPAPVTLQGRTITLEPLHAARQSPAIWNAVQSHDEVWTWLADGPYADESGLRAALESAEGSGLRLEPLGSGLAREQVPAAGTMVPIGTEVVVRFSR